MSGPFAIELKSLSDDVAVVGGYAVLWDGTDITGDYFTKDCDFWFDRLTETPPVLYQHGQDAGPLKAVLGKVIEKHADDIGLWADAQIDLHAKYADVVVGLVKRGILGYSTGAVSHLVERATNARRGAIKSWPIAELSLTPIPADPRTLGVAVKALAADDLDYEVKAVWTTAAINDLPDSSFLMIESGGKKDGDGKTTPRSLRHFPVKDNAGKVDLPHVRNALARIPQSSISAADKKRLTGKARAMLSAASASSKSLKALMGSYEHRMDALGGEFREWQRGGDVPWGDDYAYIISSFDDHVVVMTGSGEYYAVPYTVTDQDADEFEFGAPEAVELQAVPDPDGDEEAADAGKSLALKAGRVMSARNQNQLHTAIAAMGAVHAATCDQGDKCPLMGATTKAIPILTDHTDDAAAVPRVTAARFAPELIAMDLALARARAGGRR